MRASQAGTAHKGSRVQGVTGDQAISAGKPAALRRIVVGTPAAGTITVKDGATVKNIVTVVAGQAFFLDFDMQCNTSLVITPSVVGLDLLVVWD